VNDDPADLREDRTLRNTSKALLAADVAHLLGHVAIKSDGKRIMRIAGEEARDLASKAGSAARRHRGPLALAGGAIALWLARRPILSLLARVGKREDSGQDVSTAAEHSEQP
jgi:hypothetical protein